MARNALTPVQMASNGVEMGSNRVEIGSEVPQNDPFWDPFWTTFGRFGSNPEVDLGPKQRRNEGFRLFRGFGTSRAPDPEMGQNRVFRR